MHHPTRRPRARAVAGCTRQCSDQTALSPPPSPLTCVAAQICESITASALDTELTLGVGGLHVAHSAPDALGPPSATPCLSYVLFTSAEKEPPSSSSRTYDFVSTMSHALAGTLRPSRPCLQLTAHASKASLALL